MANSYGGEARLRVLLYALPWCCAAAGWVWWPGYERVRRQTALATVHLGFALVLFVFTFLGHEDLNIVSASEVRAAAFVSDPDIVKPGSVVATMTLNLPPRYNPFAYELGSTDNLLYLSDSQFGRRPLAFPDQSDINALLAALRANLTSPDGDGFIAFSRGTYAWSRDYQMYRPYEMQAFEGEVARSGRFRLVFNTPTARIYEVVKRPGHSTF